MSNNDDKIKSLLKKVEAQKDALGTKPKAVWNTNGVFKFNDVEFFNLNTVNDPIVLVEALSFLLTTQRCNEEAANALGVEIPTFNWHGYSILDYTSDFRNRIKMIEYDTKKKQLMATEKKLASLMSEDARTASELEDIEALLG